MLVLAGYSYQAVLRRVLHTCTETLASPNLASWFIDKNERFYIRTDHCVEFETFLILGPVFRAV